jgi:hypothetical protein
MKAARERKQKIVVAIGGVVLAGLMVIQGPKLLDAFGGGGSDSSTATPAATATPQATPATGTPSATATPTTPSVEFVRAPKSARAQLAGVVIVPEQPVQPGDGQLGSFSRFDSKDPFVQQVKEAVAGAAAQAAPAQAQAPKAADAAVKAGASGSAASGGQPATGSASSAPAVLPTLAMLRVNGKLVSLEAGKRFPSGDGAFVVKSLKRNSVGIAVADGEFAGGGVLTLRLGRQVTLVNTATGARYVVKLVFLGDEANVTRFSTK